MSERDKQEAAQDAAAKARRQATHATKNVTRAAQLGVEIAAEQAKDTLVHAAEYVEEGTAEVVDDIQRVAPKISTSGLAALSSDLGVAFLATSVSIWSGLVAYYKFKAVITGRGRAVK